MTPSEPLRYIRLSEKRKHQVKFNLLGNPLCYRFQKRDCVHCKCTNVIAFPVTLSLMQFQVTRWSLQESHFFPFPQPIFCLFRSVITLTFSTRMFRIPGVFVFILTHARPRPHTKWPNWREMCCICVPWDRMTTHLKRNEKLRVMLILTVDVTSAKNQI